jgi:hypothetical protein
LAEIVASDVYAESAPALVREGHSNVTIDGSSVENRVLDEDVASGRK